MISTKNVWAMRIISMAHIAFFLVNFLYFMQDNDVVDAKGRYTSSYRAPTTRTTTRRYIKTYRRSGSSGSRYGGNTHVYVAGGGYYYGGYSTHHYSSGGGGGAGGLIACCVICCCIPIIACIFCGAAVRACLGMEAAEAITLITAKKLSRLLK